MIAKYPIYKDSGLDWLGDTPAHWEKQPNIALFRERIERGFQDSDLLSVTIERGIILQEELETKKDISNEDKSNYKRVCVGDLAYNKMRMWQGAVGYSDFEGIVSPAYVILAPRVNLNPKYFHYLFRTQAYTNESYRNSYGIHDDQLSLRYKDFKRMYSVVPPKSEQDAIVAYLDGKVGEIDAFVARKRQLIALLQEQKQAVINRAVTQGLDPHAPRKPSGLPWLGDIPAHWQEKRAKYFFREIDERSETGSEELLSVSHITGVTPRSEKEITMFKAESYEGYKTCQPDDLVINIMWAWMGAMGVSRHHGIVSSAYGVYRQKNSRNFYSPYLDHLLRAKPYIAEFTCRSTGIRSSRLRMYTDDFFDIPVVCPPYKEQIKIVEHIESESVEFDQAVDLAEKEIELIEAYRTSLIAHAVTGKIDVRCVVGVAHHESLND